MGPGRDAQCGFSWTTWTDGKRVKEEEEMQVCVQDDDLGQKTPKSSRQDTIFTTNAIIGGEIFGFFIMSAHMKFENVLSLEFFLESSSVIKVPLSEAIKLSNEY